MRVYTTSLGWGILNRHFGDYCTGGDVTAPRALAQSEGLAGVAERSQFSRAVEGLPAGMSYPRWRNEANLRAWPELRNEANSGRLPTQCGPPVGMWYPRWRNEANPRAWPELRNEANLERCSTHEYFTVPARHRAPGAAPKRGASWRAGSPFLDSRVAGGFGVFRVRTRK